MSEAPDVFVVEPVPDIASSDRLSSRTAFWILMTVVVAIVMPLTLSRFVDRPIEVHRFVIPDGTAARIAGGETVDILPEELDFALDDRLVLVNDDVDAHVVGPFIVPPGRTLDRSFGEAFDVSGFCSLHSSGRIDISVAGS